MDYLSVSLETLMIKIDTKNLKKKKFFLKFKNTSKMLYPMKI